MVRLFTAPKRFVTDVFIPWISMKFPDSKRPVSESRHHSSEIGSATRFHFRWLSRDRISLGIGEHARCRRFTTSPDRIARGDANRTSGVGIRKSDSSSQQTIEVRRVNVRITERSDRVEPLLIGHDEQDVGPGHNVILSKAKWSRRIPRTQRSVLQRDVSTSLDMTARL